MLGITSIVQDPKGFIWIGTYYGLFRYDGYQFSSYRNAFQDANSISSNTVNSVIKTAAGEIWVATSLGLNRYDREKDAFRSFRHDDSVPASLINSNVTAIFEDSRGSLWVGTTPGGLSRFDPASETFLNFPNAAEQDHTLVGIAEDRSGGLLVVTTRELRKFDPDTSSTKSFRGDERVNGFGKSLIRSIRVDRWNNAWISTIGGGLTRFDPESERFKRYVADQNNPNSLGDNLVLGVHETRTGSLWVGTGASLSLYRRATDDFLVYRNDPANAKSLGKGEIWAVLEDKDDQLWVGGNQGLDKFNQKTNRFVRFRNDLNDPIFASGSEVLSIFEDHNQAVWIGIRGIDRGGRLDRYDLRSKTFEVVEGLGEIRPFAIRGDSEGKLWIGTAGELIHYDPVTGNTKKYRPEPDNPNSLGSGTISRLVSDSSGNLLVATLDGGLSRFDRQTRRFTNFRHDPDDPDSLTDNQVHDVMDDSRGELWVGTFTGLDRLDAATQKFVHYRHEPNDPQSISANDILSIFEDRDGTIWIGTTTGGLNRFDRATGNFTHLTERDGLPSNDVFDILQDDDGKLWLCTDRGLARFDIETGAIRIYDRNDGVPYNPFDNKTAFKNSRGQFYFGGQDGFVRFEPKELTDSQEIPPVYLTGIRIFEQPLKTTLNVSEMKELALSWRDYVVSFDFAALDMTNPAKLRYQWKLDGFDPEWIDGGTRRTATYTNLPGGDYVLKVKATNADGVWGPETLGLKINVTPPFYQTYWFYGLAILTVGLIVVGAYRARISRLGALTDSQKRFTRDLITSQEGERKRIASELHDGLGQILVIIKNRAALGLAHGKDSDRMTRELDSISASASQALDEVREITNNLRPQLLDRLGLTKALKAMLRKVAAFVEIESNIDNIDQLFSEADEISVYRIVQESVNNILKHSNASNGVVTIRHLVGRVSIMIEDNGRGFDVGILDGKRTGLGLVGLKERANLLGGTIKIRSTSEEGTRIIVDVPVRGNTTRQKA